jgi:hypothetical protein
MHSTSKDLNIRARILTNYRDIQNVIKRGS